MIAMARPWIGLALGSGSARGWSHIGIIKFVDLEGLLFRFREKNGDQG